MIRGNPAPVGYAATVSGWLRVYVARQRLGGGLQVSAQLRLNKIDAVANLPVAVGDDDPRIRALSIACPGARWEPSNQQLAVIQLAGEGEEALTADGMLNALAHAAVVDMEMNHKRQLAHAEKATAAASSPEDVGLRGQLDAERAAHAQTRIERDNMRAGQIAEKARRREAEAALREGFPFEQSVPTVQPDKAEKRERLPAGVRRRGNDSFQAYWRDHRGKQKQKDGFASVEEAVTFRTAEMDRVAEARKTPTAPTMSAGATYDDKTSVEMAAEEAIGRAA